MKIDIKFNTRKITTLFPRMTKVFDKNRTLYECYFVQTNRSNVVRIYDAHGVYVGDQFFNGSLECVEGNRLTMDQTGRVLSVATVPSIEFLPEGVEKAA